ENLAGIAGMGVACDRAAARLAAGEPARIDALGVRLLESLTHDVPGARLHGDRERRVQAIVNVGFPGFDGEALLHELDRRGVTVSTGSACSAASPGPSHVLMALGLRPEDAHASVRFSLGDGNTEADVDRILTVTPGIVERLRALGEGDPAAGLSRASA